MQTNESVIFWNCARGVFSKKCFIEKYISDFNPLAFFISECDITGDQCLDALKISGYQLEVAPTLESRNKGRIMVYYKSGLNIKRVKNLENNHDNLIALDTPKMLLIGLYAGFQTYDDETMIGNFERLINTSIRAVNTPKCLLIGGDFNCDLTRKDQKTKLLNLWTATHGLTQIVEGKTRSRIVTNVLQESSIDLIFTNDPSQFESKLENSAVSDHRLLIAKPKFKTDKLVTRKKVVIDWRNYNDESFNTSLRRNCESIVPSSNVDYAEREMVIAITKSMNEIIPLRAIRLRRQTDIESAQISSLQKKRDRQLKKARKTGNQEDLQKVKDLNHEIKRVVKKEKKKTGKIKN